MSDSWQLLLVVVVAVLVLYTSGRGGVAVADVLA